MNEHPMVGQPGGDLHELTTRPLKGRIIGGRILFLKETASTNDDVLRMGRDRGCKEGLVVVADYQSHGRGRHGRKWISPPGVNLYFTVLLRPPIPPEEATILSLMASVAVVDGIRRYTGIHASIKWPNDIMIGDKKVGGILMEARTKGGIVEMVALGIGINVNMHSGMFDREIRGLATSLKEEAGQDIHRPDLLREILGQMDYWYNELLKGNRGLIIEEWRRRDSTMGNEVVVQMLGSQGRPAGGIRGLAEDIDERGCLVIRLSSGAIRRVSSGDVTILRKD
jgi:BirA family biotin operon repressor/biotin-[acetyl-CoA-carboxylase] ligase